MSEIARHLKTEMSFSFEYCILKCQPEMIYTCSSLLWTTHNKGMIEIVSAQIQAVPGDLLPVLFDKTLNQVKRFKIFQKEPPAFLRPDICIHVTEILNESNISLYSPQVAFCKEENILSVAASILKSIFYSFHNFNKIQHIPVSFFPSLEKCETG